MKQLPVHAFLVLVEDMKAFILIKGQVSHRIVNADDRHHLNHLVSNQIEERGSPLTLDVLKGDNTDLSSFILVEQRKLESTCHCV